MTEPCSWCGDPATEQVLTGWHLTGLTHDGPPIPHFAWMCDRDATDYKNERNHSRGH